MLLDFLCSLIFTLLRLYLYIANTGQPGYDRQKRTGRTEQAEKDRQNRTARTVQPVQNSQNRAARKDSQNGTG
jgi:hypothetical protein